MFLTIIHSNRKASGSKRGTALQQLQQGHCAGHSGTVRGRIHLRYYAYICLDVFKEEKPRIGEKIDTWLEFLTIQDTDKMETFLKKNKSFQNVYERVILIL